MRVLESISQEFEETLQSNCGRGLNWFLWVSLLFGFALSLVSIAVGFGLGFGSLHLWVVGVVVFVAPLPLHFFAQHYWFELRKRAKERLVPDLLLQASAFPRGSNFDKMIEYFSHERFGLLGEEFEKASAEIEKGATVQCALGNIAKRCKSSVVSRAMRLLVQGFESGADMSLVFREAASDLLETNSILRERNAALVIEKYTLLFAGGLIVPVVLGLLVSMVSSMDFSAFELLGFGGTLERTRLLGLTVAANQLYIVEYSLLAAFFVASLEGNRKKALFYAVFLLPLSLLSFHAAKGWLGFGFV